MDTTAVDAAIVTALEDAAGDHDSTPEIEAIETAVADLAGGVATGASASFVFDNSVINTRNELKAVLDAIFEQAKSGLVPA